MRTVLPARIRLAASRAVVVMTAAGALTIIGASAVAPADGQANSQCVNPATPPPARAAPAARRGLIVGLSTVLGVNQGQRACNLLAAARASGASELREDLDWTVVSPQRGARNWTPFDRVVKQAAQWGLIVLPVLDGRPSWIGNAADRRRQFASLTADAAARYGPGGTFWRANPSLARYAPVWFELGNQPYEPGPNRMSALDYARLVVASVRAGRHANPAAKFLAAAERVYQRRNGHAAYWIDDLFAAQPNLGRYVDAFAVHPYANGPPAAFNPTNRRFQVGRIEDIHRRIARHDRTPPPIWITELGWSTCTSQPGCVSLSQQAADITALFKLARTRWASYVRAVFIFSYSQPASVATPSGKFDGYGLVDADLDPKPALSAFQAAASAR
jgi:hypothetical protein